MTRSLPDPWNEVLRRNELFGSLDDTALGHLGRRFEEMEVAAGTDVVRQGDEADSLFLVVEGRLDVILEGAVGQVLRQLGPGSILGEVALLIGGRRSATARATEATRMLRLSRQHFDALVLEHPVVMGPLREALHSRMRRGRIAGHLRDLFGPLDADALADIERQLTWIHLESGRELFRQGEVADGAYFVVVGRVRVAVRDGAGGERIVDDSGPGEWIGEMALLTQRERSATVYAVRDSDLVWLPSALFDSLITRHPRAMRETARVIVSRLQRHLSGAVHARPKMSTLAIVPASPNVACLEFARALVTALERYGSVLHLTAERVDKELGKPGIARVSSDDPAGLRLAPWLLEQEETHRFVVYQGDDTWSGWTDRAVRQADHLLYVADGRHGPASSEVFARQASRFAGGRAPKQSLVLLQAAHKDRFSDTARWLDHVDEHHHVRTGSKTDVARLVRILTGNAVCVVLGGGGSRGYAHLGILKAFEELRIPIDAIAGTSIGALVGAGTALGIGSAELATMLPPLLVRCFADVTLPLVSLLAGTQVMGLLEGFTGTTCVEDLATPFFSVSTNLTRGGQVTHRRGPVPLAVRASTAIPGVFPPVPWNGDLLVDGGLCNNVPVNTMASLFGGAIVAVDVMPEVDLSAPGAIPTSLSGWTVARKRLNPFAESSGMPGIVSILVRSATMASQSLEKAEEARRLSSLYLRPPVDRWNIVDFRTAKPLVNQGYRGTIKDIEAWWSRDKGTLLGKD